MRCIISLMRCIAFPWTMQNCDIHQATEVCTRDRPMCLLSSSREPIGTEWRALLCAIWRPCMTQVVACAGRIASGLACGAASLYVPRYVAEVAPPGIRGTLSTGSQVGRQEDCTWPQSCRGSREFSMTSTWPYFRRLAAYTLAGPKGWRGCDPAASLL